MSDFSPRSFKWTEIVSLILELKIEGRNKIEDLGQLRQYARKKYKSDNPIGERFHEYLKNNLEIYEILVLMFGDP